MITISDDWLTPRQNSRTIFSVIRAKEEKRGGEESQVILEKILGEITSAIKCKKVYFQKVYGGLSSCDCRSTHHC